MIEKDEKIELLKNVLDGIEVEVDSSSIKKILYDIDDRDLIITFKQGVDYRYLEVEPSEIVDLVLAESIGRQFAKEVKPHHEVIKISD